MHERPLAGLLKRGEEFFCFLVDPRLSVCAQVGEVVAPVFGVGGDAEEGGAEFVVVVGSGSLVESSFAEDSSVDGVAVAVGVGFRGGSAALEEEGLHGGGGDGASAVVVGRGA